MKETQATYLTPFEHIQRHNHEIMRQVSVLEDKAIEIISNMDITEDISADGEKLKQIYADIDALQGEYWTYTE